MNTRNKALLYIISTPFYMSVGCFAGLLIGLCQDFGVSHMAANIRLNPDIFFDQYLDSFLLYSVLLVVTAAIHIMAFLFFTFYGKAKEKASPN